MSLRFDVRELRDLADGLLVGWVPSRLPEWTTSEGGALAWFLLAMWRKYYDASVARLNLEARVRILEDNVDGLRETNRILTDEVERTRSGHTP